MASSGFPQMQDAHTLIARTTAGRARLRQSTADVAALLTHVTEQLALYDANSGNDSARSALVRQQRDLWALREVHAKGMRQVGFTIGEVADALGVSMSMARKIVTRPPTSSRG